MIKDIPLSILDSNELVLLSSRIRERCRGAGIPDAVFSRLLTALAEDEATLQAVLNRPQKGAYTGVLQEKDTLRDNAYLLFRDFVKTFIRSPDGGMREAALRLHDLFEQIGFSLQDEGYARQTALAEQLSCELEKPENRAALERLSAVPFYTDWAARERDFQAALREKEDLNARKALPWRGEARDRLSTHLYTVLALVRFYLESEGERYGLLGKGINESAADLLKTARARQTRAESAAEEEPSS